MSSSQLPPQPRSAPVLNAAKVTIPGLKARKLTGERIVAATAYDFPSASLCDEAGIDLVLVGDSLANTVLGYENTLPVTFEEMMAALRAVRRGVRRALVVLDLPFGSYHASEAQAIETGVQALKAGAEAVKLEGGQRRGALVKRLVQSEIPVIGHIGITPQSLHSLGGYRVQGKTPESAAELLEDALALEEAGAFALVLEGMPSSLAKSITARLDIPTIGIGAGPACDGQILVFADLLGILPGKKPRFVRQYLDFHGLALAALRAYRGDVLAGEFPAAREGYEATQGAAPLKPETASGLSRMDSLKRG